MRAFGGILIGIGVVWLLIALNMDTSVETSGMYGLPSRVENIGLISQRQNHMMIGGLVTLVGVLLAIFGGRSDAATASASAQKREVEAPDERDLSNDGYRLWLAERYDIKRNDVFASFVMGERMFPDLDQALAAAHDIEAEAVQEQENERRAMEERAQQAREAQAEAQRLFWKRDIWMIVGVMAALFAAFGAVAFYMSKQDEKAQAERRQEAAAKLKGTAWTIYPTAKVSYVDEDRGYPCDKLGAPVLHISFTTPDTSEQVASYYHSEAVKQGLERDDDSVEYEQTYQRIYRGRKDREFMVDANGGTVTDATICIRKKGK